MPTLFLCFIVFIIWFRVKSKQGDKVSVWDENYWDRERKANFSRKKDISDLDYLNLDLTLLPVDEISDDDEAEYIDKLHDLSQSKILNLNNMTNAEIKLKYGQANFEKLSLYDQNYTLLLRILGQWGNVLYEKKEYEKAKKVYIYAIETGSDITATYINLAKIYIHDDEPDKISELINFVKDKNFYMKDSIIEKLNKVLSEYR